MCGVTDYILKSQFAARLLIDYAKGTYSRFSRKFHVYEEPLLRGMNVRRHW